MTNYGSKTKQKFIVPLIALDFYKALDPVLIIHSENNSAPEISAQILMRMNSPTDAFIECFSNRPRKINHINVVIQKFSRIAGN
jgi:hypothetical protein